MAPWEKKYAKPTTEGGGAKPWERAYAKPEPEQPSFLKRLADAYVRGNQQLNQATLGEKARIFANDLTFNAFDPVVGAISPWSTVEDQRKATEVAREHAPAGFEIASGVLGGLASGGGLAKGGLTLAKIAPAGRGLGAGAGRAGINAAEQAALSGASAFNRGAGWEDISTEAAIGGGAGGAASALGGVFGRFGARRAAAPQIEAAPIQTKEQAFAASKGKYEGVKQAGATYTDTSPLNTSIDAAIADETLHPAGDKATLDVIRQIKKDLLAKGGVTPEMMDRSRRYVREKLITGVKDDNQRRIGGKLMQAIDDYTGSSQVAVPPGSTATAADINKDLKSGRELYARGKRSQRVEEADIAAKARAEGSGSALSLQGGNLENTRRQEFRKLLQKSEEGKLPSAYNAPEAALLGELKGGTVGRDIGRYLGTTSPLRGTMPASIQLGAGLASGGAYWPYQIGQAAGAEGAGFIGKKATEMTIDDLQKMILTGLDPRGDPATVNAMRDLLARTAASGVRGGRQGR